VKMSKGKKVTRTLCFACSFVGSGYRILAEFNVIYLFDSKYYLSLNEFCDSGDLVTVRVLNLLTEPVYTYTCTMRTIDSICGISHLFMIY